MEEAEAEAAAEAAAKVTAGMVGVAEAVGARGRTPPIFWQNRRRRLAAAAHTPHYYLPTQIFRPSAIPVQRLAKLDVTMLNRSDRLGFLFSARQRHRAVAHFSTSCFLRMEFFWW